MKLIKKIKVTKEEEILDDILCNKCGNSCRENNSVNDFYGLIETIVFGGFCSPYLLDNTSYTFSICEHCLDELFNSFKHKPEIREE